MDITSPSLHNLDWAPMNAPPPGISADEHARAWQESVQVTSQNHCTYCDKYGHSAGHCKYLNPTVRNPNWHPDPALWVYMPTLNNGMTKRQKKSRGWEVDPQTWTNFKGHGSSNVSLSIQLDVLGMVNAPQSFDLVPIPIGNLAAANFPRHRWAVSLGSFHHTTNNKDSFTDYHEFAPGEAPYRFRDSTGAIRSAVGIGRVRVNLLVGICRPGYHSDFMLDAVYCPGLPFSILSLNMAYWKMNLVYNVDTWSLLDMSTERLVANTFQEEFTLFLRTNAR